MGKDRKSPPSHQVSPWAHMADEIAAGVVANRELCVRLGLAFRGVQQESYIHWSAWEQQLEDEDSDGDDPDPFE